ncbi:MAG: hypothetical protein JO250_05080 [Armatimonadetes bacterium]|nr:hypothetical protein [Armatimonadota bacterium]
MEILLLGTAAAEGWPCPWCACAACAEARRRGGRDLRSRSNALIDDVVKVDFNADTLMQMQRAGRDLTRLSTLVFTHAHNDHCTPAELQYRGPWFVADPPPLLHVYGSAPVVMDVRAALGDLDPLRLEVHPPLEPFQAVTTSDGTEILPLPAAHVPGTFLLRLTRGGRRLFYGHDSGTYPDETVAALAGTPLDMALFDCTYGPQPHEYKGHLGIDGVLQMAERLRAVGAVTERTRLVATHFSHNGGMLQEDLAARFAPHHVDAAYDGMIVNL